MRVLLKNNFKTVAILDMDIEKGVLHSVSIVPGQEIMAKIYFPKIDNSPNYTDFQNVFKFYINDKSDTKLSSHLKYIQDGEIVFHTQLRRNLNIEVEN